MGGKRLGEMDDLKATVASLVESLQPDRVVLCPSAAGEAPIDLLVIKDTRLGFLARRQEALGFLPVGSQVEVLVYTPIELEEMCRQENPFVIRALEQGKELYRRPPLA